MLRGQSSQLFCALRSGGKASQRVVDSATAGAPSGGGERPGVFERDGYDALCGPSGPLRMVDGVPVLRDHVRADHYRWLYQAGRFRG